MPGGQDFLFSPPNNQPAHGLISFISRTLVRLRHCCSSVQAPDASDFITRWSGSHTEEPTVVAAAAGHGHSPTCPHVHDSGGACSCRQLHGNTTASTTLAPTAALPHHSSHGAACPHLSAHGGTYPLPHHLRECLVFRLRRQTARHRAEQLVRCSPRRRSASATLRTGTFGRCESDTVLCSAQSSNISFWCLASSTTQSRRRDTLVTRAFDCPILYLHGFLLLQLALPPQQQQLANAAQLARSLLLAAAASTALQAEGV